MPSLAFAQRPAGYPTDFGNQWVRNHPFTLGGWLTGSLRNYPLKHELFQGAGLNTATYDVLPNLPAH